MTGRASVVYVGYSLRKSLVEAVEWINRNTGVQLDFKYYNVDDVNYGRISREEYVESLVESDILLLDIRGGDNIYKYTVEAVGKNRAKAIVSLVGGSEELVELTRLGKFSPRVFKKGRFKGFFKAGRIDYGTITRIRDMFEKIGKILPYGILRDARNYVYILKYYENPSFRNMVNMLLLLLRDYLGVKVNYRITGPENLPPMGIYDFHTGKIYTDTMEYLENYKYRDKPLIGVLFYGGHHFDQSIVAAEKISEKLEEKGYGVIPVFSGDLRYYLAIKKYFIVGEPLINVLIDLLWFRFAGGPLGGDHNKTYAVLKLLNTPILHGIHLSSTINEWASKNTISPIEVITTVILPELDGRIEPVVTHGRRIVNYKGYSVDVYEAIDDRVERITCRADKWAKLRSKSNRDKKVAIIIYAYPPGKENIGKASYLDVFASLEKLLSRLAEAGYYIPRVPSRDEIRDKLLHIYLLIEEKNSGSICSETICMDREAYMEILDELPSDKKDEILEFWGNPDKIGNIPIPGFIMGNAFIGIQPSRGKHEDPSKIYHSRNIPPTHEYVAFYKWITKIFKADVIIHLGTHGTLEFLPGKEVGLTGKCYPDILIGCTPNIYVYHVVNPSESSIAKRRSYALIINHSTPPYMKYEPPEEVVELERLISQYYELKQYSPSRAMEILELIKAKAERMGFGTSIEEVQDRIEDYKRTLMPKGLHVLGDKPSQEELLDYLLFISRFDRGNVKSLYRLIAESEELNYEDILSGMKGYSKLYEYLEAKARRIIDEYMNNKLGINDLVEKYELENINRGELARTLEYLAGVAENIRSSDEIGAVLKALNGEYIMPGPGGDPLRNPEVYPTGRNMYQLDPTNIPTDTAWKRGETIAEEIVRRYYREHGEYPRTVSMILWAFETMKTGGETVAAIFRLLGVRPVWKTGYIRELEVIPLEKLGRPRIDVLINICGIFRDTFYNIVELLDKAFKTISQLNEPPEMNYVKLNNQLLSEKLGGSVYYRIFGPPPDKYATELTTMIEASSWSSEDDLVGAYVESMKYIYGENIHGVEKEDLFRELASTSRLVVQVRDTVEYEVTDLDHYYEFLGGLSRTVEKLSGKNPAILVADSTREKIRVEDVGESIRRGVITRLLNPVWINEMLKHDYHGGEKIATRVENLLGLAATTHKVDDELWDNIAEKLVLDEETYTRITMNNPWAMRKIIEKLIEAYDRGYWKTSSNTIAELRKLLERTNNNISDREIIISRVK